MGAPGLDRGGTEGAGGVEKGRGGVASGAGVEVDREGDGGEGGDGEIDADDVAGGVAPGDGPDGERGPDEGFEAAVAAEPVTEDGESQGG